MEGDDEVAKGKDSAKERHLTTHLTRRLDSILFIMLPLM